MIFSWNSSLCIKQTTPPSGLISAQEDQMARVFRHNAHMTSTEFLSDSALSSAIHDMLATNDCLNLAVAFWGNGSEARFKKQTYSEVRIVCNLSMGGTNPGAVRKLIERFSDDNVRQLDTLHAKVLIGDEHVIVSSANISTNGVGDDTETPATWREAGYRKTATKAEQKWFEEIFATSRRITEDDLVQAEAAWKERAQVAAEKQSKSGKSLLDYDFERADFPLLYWYDNSNEWNPTEEAKEKFEEHTDDKLRAHIADSVDVETEAELKILKPGRFLLSFEYSDKNPTELAWYQVTSEFIKDAYTYVGEEDEKIDIVIVTDKISQPPFSISDAHFMENFKRVIKKRTYSKLFREPKKAGWFEENEALIKKFWIELKTKLI